MSKTKWKGFEKGPGMEFLALVVENLLAPFVSLCSSFPAFVCGAGQNKNLKRAHAACSMAVTQKCEVGCNKGTGWNDSQMSSYSLTIAILSIGNKRMDDVVGNYTRR